jgi:hypothetical protein
LVLKYVRVQWYGKLEKLADWGMNVYHAVILISHRINPEDRRIVIGMLSQWDYQ